MWQNGTQPNRDECVVTGEQVLSSNSKWVKAKHSKTYLIECFHDTYWATELGVKKSTLLITDLYDQVGHFLIPSHTPRVTEPRGTGSLDCSQQRYMSSGRLSSNLCVTAASPPAIVVCIATALPFGSCQASSGCLRDLSPWAPQRC